METLVNEGCNVNCSDKNGWSPLIIAAYSGNEQLCSILLKAGANPNMTNQNGTTPLMYAADYSEKCNQFDLCKLLIESGAKPKARDNFGRSVYDYALKQGKNSVIEFFGEYA